MMWVPSYHGFMCDVTVRQNCEELTSNLYYVYQAVYTVNVQNSYFKCFATVLIYSNPHFFRVHNFHFLELTLSLSLHSIWGGPYRSVKYGFHCSFSRTVLHESVWGWHNECCNEIFWIKWINEGNVNCMLHNTMSTHDDSSRSIICL